MPNELALKTSDICFDDLLESFQPGTEQANGSKQENLFSTDLTGLICDWGPCEVYDFVCTLLSDEAIAQKFKDNVSFRLKFHQLKFSPFFHTASGRANLFDVVQKRAGPVALER